MESRVPSPPGSVLLEPSAAGGFSEMAGPCSNVLSQELPETLLVPLSELSLCSGTVSAKADEEDQWQRL